MKRITTALTVGVLSLGMLPGIADARIAHPTKTPTSVSKEYAEKWDKYNRAAKKHFPKGDSFIALNGGYKINSERFDEGLLIISTLPDTVRGHRNVLALQHKGVRAKEPSVYEVYNFVETELTETAGKSVRQMDVAHRLDEGFQVTTLLNVNTLAHEKAAAAFEKDTGLDATYWSVGEVHRAKDANRVGSWLRYREMGNMKIPDYPTFDKAITLYESGKLDSLLDKEKGKRIIPTQEEYRAMDRAYEKGMLDD